MRQATRTWALVLLHLLRIVALPSEAVDALLEISGGGDGFA